MPREIITDWQTACDILDAAHVIHLALVDQDGPYCVPVNFARKGHALYLHSSTAGKKLDAMRADNRVSFAVETDLKIKTAATACKWGYDFRSVVGFGTATVVEDAQERLEGMNAIIEKWAGETLPMNEKMFQTQTLVVRIDITSATVRIRN